MKCDVHTGDENTNKADAKSCPDSDVLEKEVTKQETTLSCNVHEENSDDPTKKTDGEESPSHFVCKDEGVIKINTPVKHDVLHEAVDGLITDNIEKETFDTPETSNNKLSPPALEKILVI